MNEHQEKIDVQIQREYESKGKSRLRQYQDLVVGDRSILFLIKYELVTLIATRVPGALGLLLRKFLYPMILGKVEHGVVFGVDVWLRHPKKIRIGAGSIIDDGVLLDAKGTGADGIKIGGNCYIGRGSILSCKDGDIVLENYANISTFCNISSNSTITIGEKTLLGPHCSIFATSHNFESAERSALDQGWTSKGVVIGKHCWLGAQVVVLDGVKVGDNTIVGAGAMVKDDLPENVVAVGAPAKPIKQRK